MREFSGVMRGGISALLAVLVVSMTGCGIQQGATVASATPSLTAQSMLLKGNAMGGAVPITGAAITLYSSSTGAPSATNNSGKSGPYIGTAIVMATATTDSSGSFGNPSTSPWTYSVTTCTPGQVLYLVTEGGNTGSGINVNVVNAAVLGIAVDSSCDLYQSQAVGSSVRTALTSTYTNVDEVTTVATAYAFQSFLSTTGSYNSTVVNITAPANNSVLLDATLSGSGIRSTNDVASGTVSTASGLQHAFYNYANLVNSHFGTANLTLPAYAAGVPTGVTSPVMPTVVLNTIANVLQYCTNSVATTGDTAGDGQPCGSLYQYTPSQGNAPGSGAATSSLGAALNLARNPWVSAANVTNFFNLAPGSGAVAYSPSLVSAPRDWTLAISYPVPPNPVGGIGFPFGLTLDADDNVYVTTPENDPFQPNSTTTQTTPDSVSACLFGWTSYGLFRPSITPYTVGTGQADSAPQYGVTSGTMGTGTPGTSTWFCSGKQNAALNSWDTFGTYGLTNLAADNQGNLWISNFGGSTGTIGLPELIEINATPTAVASYTSGSSGYVGIVTPPLNAAGTPAVKAPFAITVDKSNNIWYVTNSGNGQNIFSYNAGALAIGGNTPGSGVNPALVAAGRSLAFDSAGNIWTAAFGGTSGGYSTLGLGGQIDALPLSPVTQNLSNYLTASASQLRIKVLGGASGTSNTNTSPYGLAADGYGNIWVTGGSTNSCGSAVATGTTAAPTCNIFQSTTSGSLGLTKCTPTPVGGPYTSAICVTKVSNASGTTMSPKYVEADGNNVIWMMDSYNVGVQAFASTLSTPALISEATGFSPCIPNNTTYTYPDAYASPKGIVVDSTGAVWYTTPDIANTYPANNANMLIQIIGTGTSVWPLLAVQNPGVAPQ
jgi:hypothetical protein